MCSRPPASSDTIEGADERGRVRWEVTLPGRSVMYCLYCDIDLDEQQACGLTIDVCPECGSTWFDRGELELFKYHSDRKRLKKIKRSARFEQTSTITLDCPKCETDTLVMGEIGGYEAGQCSECLGVWVKLKKSRYPTPTLDYLVALAFDVAAGPKR